MRIGLLSTADAPLLGYQIDAFTKHGVPVDAIIFDAAGLSDKDRRLHEERTGGRLPPLPLERFDALRIPRQTVADHRAAECTTLVRSLALDLLINAGTPRILPEAVLRSPSVGVVNCHPGLLPQFRGCTCVEWAVYLDEPVGNTVHFMDAGIDTGPIVLQESLRFSRDDRYVDVRVKVYEHGLDLLARGVKKIIAERLTPARLPAQPPGRHYNVIDDDKMTAMLQKLASGTYAYQGEQPQEPTWSARQR